MQQVEVEKAFSVLSEVLGSVGSEINNEMNSIEQKIQYLKDRIIELKSKQEALAHDRSTIEEMYNKYNKQNTDLANSVF